MQVKLHRCDGPCQNPAVVTWKRDGRLRYCKNCWKIVSAKSVPTNKGPQPKSRIKQTSDKRAVDQLKYIAVRTKFMDKHPICMAGILGCTVRAVECHHKRGKVGADLYDETNLLAVCRTCHNRIENERAMAIEMGFSELRTNK